MIPVVASGLPVVGSLALLFTVTVWGGLRLLAVAEAAEAASDRADVAARQAPLTGPVAPTVDHCVCRIDEPCRCGDEAALRRVPTDPARVNGHGWQVDR